MDTRVYHYVRGNRTCRMPRRHVFLDTESKSERTRVGHRQTWRLAVASLTAAEKGRRGTSVMKTFTDPIRLWRTVSEHCRKRSRTILWAHNLGYDARISEAFTELPGQGWRLEGHNLASRGAWLQWRREGTSLLMVDSASVYPTSIAQLAKTFGMVKPDLPDDADDMAVWQRRCQSDVDILQRAVETYLGWLESENLGNWQMTGAGQSYAAFRHRFMRHELLVHADLDALAAERRAMWTGRCEAYWHGRTGFVGVEEWDLSLAYARIARDNPLPIRLLGRAANVERLEAWLANPKIAVLAEVDVDTSVPTLPTHHGGRICWPVGRFTTTVWDPELRLALRHGARLTPRRVWLYRREPALYDWATWIIDQLEGQASTVEPWKAIILKHWSRALIGRFGMNYQQWEPYGAVEDMAVRQCPVYDTATGTETQMTQVGVDILVSNGVVEWDQSMPAVTGYVASVGRVQLWELLQAMGPRGAIYADTDSILVTGEHHDRAAALAATPLGAGLRLKSTWRGATILGPRQIITDDRVRVAGIPVRAKRLPDGRLSGEVWASLAASLRQGRPSTVETRDRKWKLHGVDRRRDKGKDGWTVPIQITEGTAQ